MTPREPSQRSVHTCFCTLCRVLKSTLMNRPIVTRTINSLCYMAPKIIYHEFFFVRGVIVGIVVIIGFCRGRFYHGDFAARVL